MNYSRIKIDTTNLMKVVLVFSDLNLRLPCNKDTAIEIEAVEENFPGALTDDRLKKGCKIEKLQLINQASRSVYAIDRFAYYLHEKVYDYFWFEPPNLMIRKLSKWMFSIIEIPNTNIYIANLNNKIYHGEEFNFVPE